MLSTFPWQEKLIRAGTDQVCCRCGHKCCPALSQVLHGPIFSLTSEILTQKTVVIPNSFFFPPFSPSHKAQTFLVLEQCWKLCSWKGLAGVIEGLISSSPVGISTTATAGCTPCPAALFP